MAIFFDVDDTLLDDRGAQRTYLAQVYTAWRDALPHSEDACRMREFLDIYEASWRLFDDVLPMLDALGDRPLGVITNGTDVQQRGKLERMGIADRFAVVLTSETAGLGKPDPRIFVQAATRLNASPEHCVHVGDDWTRDVEGARRAGFAAIWLDRRRERDEDIARDPAVRCIGSLTDLVALLD